MKCKYLNFLVLAIFTGLISSCGYKSESSEKLLRNARIITLSDSLPRAQAMAILDGKILKIGAEHEIINKFRTEETIEGKGKLCLPGIWAYLDLNQEDYSIKANSSFFEKGYTQLILFNTEKIDYLKIRENLNPAKPEIAKFYFTLNEENIDFVLSISKEQIPEILGFNVKDSAFLKQDKLELIREIKEYGLGLRIEMADLDITELLPVLNEILGGQNNLKWSISFRESVNEKALIHMKNLTIVPAFRAPEFSAAELSQINPREPFILELNAATNFQTQRLFKTTKFSNTKERNRFLNGCIYWPGYLYSDEYSTGSLENGKTADFIIINRNFINSNEDPSGIEIQLCYKKGNLVFKSY